LSVSRETLDGLAERHGLGAEVAGKLEALLQALEVEPDPPTTARSGREAFELHIADSLAGLDVPELRAALSIADLGAGAGFPGLALAAALPGAQVDLIESARRKCEVIERLAAAAGISNARALAVRAEEWAGGEGAGAYGGVTARALASLAVLCEYAAPLLEPGGVLVAWKGERSPDEERAGASAAAKLGLEPVRVLRVQPFREARHRHLHVFRKIAPTPPGFPRRPGMAVKRPLA
jgi:16S rRNA (guanine527-N7)-methyltransferase